MKKLIIMLLVTLFSLPTMAKMVEEKIETATFDARGSVILPTDYHHWVHVGTFIKENGINIFDHSEIKIPIIGNTYVEPSAFRYYQKTGQWPNGAQIVKEFTQALDNKDCDKVSHVCNTALGSAIYQDKYIGFGYMVKDKKRFPTEAGHWGFFTTGKTELPYPRMAGLKASDQCADCHIAHAKEQDFVFAAQKIGLKQTDKIIQ